MRLSWPWKKREEPRVFTGNCLVRQHTADGISVGRCWHSTYNGIRPLHGDVSQWLVPDPLSGEGGPGQMGADAYAAWPKDYELREMRDREEIKHVRGIYGC